MSKQTYHPNPQVSRLFWNNPLLYLKFCYVCEGGLIYDYFFLSYSFCILFGDVGPIRFSCFCILNLKKTICLERNKRMNYDFIFDRVLHKFPLRLSVRLSLKQIAEHSDILLSLQNHNLPICKTHFPIFHIFCQINRTLV